MHLLHLVCAQARRLRMDRRGLVGTVTGAHLIERNLRKKFLQFETYARIIDSYGERTDIESSMQIFNAAEAALLIKLKA